MQNETDNLIPKYRSRDSINRPGFISKLTYWHAFPLILKGQKRELVLEDVPANLEENEAKTLGDRLAMAISKYMGLQSALWHMFGTRFIIYGILGFIKEGPVGIVQLIILGRFIRSFDIGVSGHDQHTDTWVYGTVLIFSMFLLPFIDQGFTYILTHLALKVRIAVSTLIYRKSLKLSQSSLSKTGVGNIITLLSADVVLFEWAAQTFHYTWISPVSTIFAGIVIWQYVGIAALAGIACPILLVPFQIFSSKWFGKLRGSIASKTESRLRLVNEILNGIQLVKMYTWEAPFAQLVSDARAAEIKLYKKRALFEGFNMGLLQLCPRIALFATLAIYILTGNNLDAETAFVTLGLFRVIAKLMSTMLPLGVVLAAEAMASIKRIARFLEIEESPSASLDINQQTKNPRVYLDSVNTKWSDDGDYCLQNINLELVPGKFVCIVGPVGSGKTTLLVTILRETYLKDARSVSVQGTIGYASQTPCIFHGTVRENILCGLPFRFDWYNEVVDACALQNDFALLQFGDNTLVADRGATLSGGQKARIDLARAIYRNADIYLLDDPLSAVDASVGAHIFDNCIRRLIVSKCVLLVTNSMDQCKFADEIVILERGAVSVRGTYAELSARGHIVTTNKDKVDDAAADTHKEAGKGVVMDMGNDDVEVEFVASGGLDLGLIWKLFNVGNNTFVVLLTIFLGLATQVCISYSDLFLQIWTEAEEEGETSDKMSYILYYAYLMIPIIFLPFGWAIFHFWTCLRSTDKLHHILFAALVRAPMSFFYKNSLGRILNRFSKEMAIADQNVPLQLFVVFSLLLETIGALALVTISDPIMSLPAAILFVIIYYLRKFYVKPAASIARLESIGKSPVFAHMSSSLHGLTTVRAHKVQAQFEDKFDALQNIHSSAAVAQIVARGWFGITDQLVACLYFLVVTLSFIISKSDPSKVGLAISAIMNIAVILAFMINTSADLEIKMIAIERIFEYTDIEPEELAQRRYGLAPVNPKSDWPARGEIQFHRVGVGYSARKNVLKEISCSFHSAEKIGIVGRTGAGKTTLLSSIFRIAELNSGTIHIDGIDISKLGLLALRSKITIIPQDPILFGGTLRKNLDPFGDYDDASILATLGDTNLIDRVREKGLQTEVAENGGNFSDGEKQLISICRALLKNSKIIFLDEATAHVDTKTDALIQNLVREKFKSCTVITIAHRLGTIMNSDRVCVMDAGKIVEFDNPKVLLENNESIFYELAKKANIVS